MSDLLTSEKKSAEIKLAPESGTVFIGSIYGINDEGAALIDFPENPCKEPIKAISTLPITNQHISRKVALLFNGGDYQQPVIIGLIHSPLDSVIDSYELAQPSSDIKEDSREDNQVKVNDAMVDNKRIVLEGKEEIVLKCGEASITLTKEGKILIRGKYILNRSSGVNRIMGGSVQVN